MINMCRIFAQTMDVPMCKQDIINVEKQKQEMYSTDIFEQKEIYL